LAAFPEQENLEGDKWFMYVCGKTIETASDMIYLLTAIGLSLGGSTRVHIYTQTIHRTTQITTK